MPYLSEELWQSIGESNSIFSSRWPAYDSSKVKIATVKIPIQVGGKLRDVIEVEPGKDKDELEKIALESEKVKNFIAGQNIRKIIVVPDKIISIVL